MTRKEKEEEKEKRKKYWTEPNPLGKGVQEKPVRTIVATEPSTLILNPNWTGGQL